MILLLNELNHFERECRKVNEDLQDLDNTIFDFDQSLDTVETKVQELDNVLAGYERLDLFDKQGTLKTKTGHLRKVMGNIQKQKDTL